MADLSAYLNVCNTALVVIKRKGFAVRFDASHDMWYANKEAWELLADDPIQLLGLVAIFEHQGPTKKSFGFRSSRKRLRLSFPPKGRWFPLVF